MTLDEINLVISTIWRQENYLETTLDSLSAEYPVGDRQPLCLVVGSPVTTHIERYRQLPGFSIVEMGPAAWSWIKNNITPHKATWNYYRCLTQSGTGTRGTLILEDDIRFARGWRARLEATVIALEKHYGSGFVLVLYAAWFSALKGRDGDHLYVEYPYDQFYGTQGIYYPTEVQKGFAKYLKVQGVVGNKNHYDLLLREYLLQSSIPMFATAPCLIQHIGRTSVIETPWHESSDFVEDVTVRPSKLCN